MNEIKAEKHSSDSSGRLQQPFQWQRQRQQQQLNQSALIIIKITVIYVCGKLANMIAIHLYSHSLHFFCANMLLQQKKLRVKIINFICFDFIFNMYPRPLQQCLSCFFPSLFVFYLSPSHKLYAIPIHIFLTLLKVTLSVTLFLLVFFFLFCVSFHSCPEMAKIHLFLAQNWIVSTYYTNYTAGK